MTTPVLPFASVALAESKKNQSLISEKKLLQDEARSSEAVKACTKAVFYAMENGYTGVHCGEYPLTVAGKKVFTDKGYGVYPCNSDNDYLFGNANIITLSEPATEKSNYR